MKKNTDKLVTKQDNPLGLILFSIIYFLVQEGIYPVLAYLFWFASALFSTAIFFVAPEHILKISVIVFSVISLIIILGIMYFLGYLCKGFLKKIFTQISKIIHKCKRYYQGNHQYFNCISIRNHKSH